MIRIGICDDLVEQLQIQEEMLEYRLPFGTEYRNKMFSKWRRFVMGNGTKRQYGYHSFGY